MSATSHKYAVISDLHSNVEALTNVLADIESQGIKDIICLGDVVGYGACPEECIDALVQRSIPCVRGNHDECAVTDGDEEWGMREEAREALRWTRDRLSQASIEWLGALPRRLQFFGTEMVHASCALWPEWDYVTDERSLIRHFLFQGLPVCFNGHTHVPLLGSHRAGSRPALTPLNNTLLPRDQRVLIGVGSVGQPRDGDHRAGCVVFDPAKQTVRNLRIAYDVKGAASSIRRHGLPEALALRLEEGK